MVPISSADTDEGELSSAPNGHLTVSDWPLLFGMRGLTRLTLLLKFETLCQAVTALADAMAVEELLLPLPDGRIVYASDDGSRCRLQPVGARHRPPQRSTGRKFKAPDQLGRFLARTDPSPTADAKRLVFRRYWWVSQCVRRCGPRSCRNSHDDSAPLTLAETSPAGWTKLRVVFESYRDGHWQILKQPLGGETVELLRDRDREHALSTSTRIPTA